MKVTEGNLALFPLLAPAGAGGAYVLLDEALELLISTQN